MWMTQYAQEAKRQFRDVYGFKPTGGTDIEPLFDIIPDGEYPMLIDGKNDVVIIKDGEMTFKSDEPTSGCTNMRFEIADQDYECNASLFIKDCLDDLMPDLTEEQKAVIEKAKANNWQVKKGERCRRYDSGVGTDEEMECIEIPEMAEICTELDLWP